MSKIVLKSLSVLLGAFFIFLGLLKITPKISKDLHKDLRTEYAKYSKAFPLAKQLDFKVNLDIILIISPIVAAGWQTRTTKNAKNC